MLEGLDSIDWSSLCHAYGPADNVPELLRALASGDSDERERAAYELCGNIYHQGTVYPATVPAVPFLHELLERVDGPAKSTVAHLIALIATGKGYYEVHADMRLGETTWRNILADQGTTLEEELAHEAAVTSAVHKATAVRLLDLLPYLRDPEPEIRRAIAEAFGGYSQHKSVTLPALRAALEAETDEEARDAMTQSIEKLADLPPERQIGAKSWIQDGKNRR